MINLLVLESITKARKNKWRTNVAKKVFNIAVSLAFILLLLGYIRNTARSYRYRDLCDQYREQLNETTETNRELNDRLGRITEVVGRLSETANANVSDARGIVETVERLRTEVQELENICYDNNTIDSYYDWLDSELGLQ